MLPGGSPLLFVSAQPCRCASGNVHVGLYAPPEVIASVSVACLERAMAPLVPTQTYRAVSPKIVIAPPGIVYGPACPSSFGLVRVVFRNESLKNFEVSIAVPVPAILV